MNDYPCGGSLTALLGETDLVDAMFRYRRTTDCPDVRLRPKKVLDGDHNAGRRLMGPRETQAIYTLSCVASRVGAAPEAT